MSRSSRKAFKGRRYAVFSGFPCRSRAGQLDYNTTAKPLCQHFFSDFLTFFCDLLQVNDISSFPAVVGVSYHIVILLSRPLFYFWRSLQTKRKKACTLTKASPTCTLYYSAVLDSPNSCSRIHCKTFRSRREICTCVVPNTLAVSLWVCPPKKRRRIS